MNRSDLAESTEDMLYCSTCGVAIDPGYGPMRYLVGAKDGFFFYHEGCAASVLDGQAQQQ